MNKIYITQEQLSKLQESFSEAPFEKDEFTIGDDGNGNMGYFHIEEGYFPEWFKKSDDDIIKLYHGTTLDALENILESGEINAYYGGQHGETKGVNWFSTEPSLNFYRGALFSIDIPRSSFDSYQFHFMNNSEVTSEYKSIPIANLNLQILRIGEGYTMSVIERIINKMNGDLFEVYDRITQNDFFFDEYYVPVSSPIFITIFKQLGVCEDVLRNTWGLMENIQTEITPSEVDLSSFEIQDDLNQDVWQEGDMLDSRVRLTLLDIADDFYDSLKLKWLKPLDIVLTGSICNFNWSEFSDIDMHIIVDFSKISENIDLVREYVNTKKNEWNNEHENLNIHGFSVEVFVEDLNDDTTSEGIYSLQTNEWLKKPKNPQEMELSVRGKKIRQVAADFMNQVDDLEEEFEKTSDSHLLDVLENKVDKLIKNIGKIRRDGLSSEAKEASLGNILYKILRRMHYLDKMWKLKIAIYDKKHSI